MNHRTPSHIHPALAYVNSGSISLFCGTPHCPQYPGALNRRSRQLCIHDRGFNMTLSDSFWSFARLSASWNHPTPLPKPRRRTTVYTQQHIETIGGGNHADTLPPLHSVTGDPRLPLELIVQVVLLAAQDAVLNERESSSARLLELARVNRVCHRAILSTFVLPDLCLYGLQQIRAFTISLDEDRIGIRDLACSRVRTLHMRARSPASLQHGYGPALFDASQAQTHFEKELLPFIRIILFHCQSVETLHIEGVPRGLQRALGHVTADVREFSCLMGHYGGDLDKTFWLPDRWSHLTQLQLHGPRFRFTPTTAITLASLPQLRKLGLVVPMIVSSISSSSGDSADERAIELDLAGSINPLQILIDQSSTLEHLLLVGHGERDYVGYAEKYRSWLSSLRQPRLVTRSGARARVELVTVVRRCGEAEEDTCEIRRRVHPCEVSAWMMRRAKEGLQWFDSEQQDSNPTQEKLDHWLESYELSDHPSTRSSANATASTSALMSRTGSNTPLTARQQRVHQQRVIDAIEAADMLSDDDDDDDDESADEV